LRLELTLEGQRLTSRIEEPYTVRGSSDLPFDTVTGLPAMLKALDANEYDPNDFGEKERDWLRTCEYIRENNGHWFFSARLRQRIGETLFRLLFPEEQQRSVFDQVRRDRSDDGSGIDFEIQFDHDAPIAGELPWELLFHGDDFLVGADKGTLSRLVIFDEPPPVFQPIDELRVALLAPRPEGLDNLGTLEVDALTRAIQANTKHHAEIVWKGTRLAELEAYLSEHRGPAGPHVVHFDGHGGFGRICENRKCLTANSYSKQWCTNCGWPLDIEAQGYLAFEGPNRPCEYVTARRFADCIGRMSSVRLVIITACRSGAALGGETVFNGVAQRLLERHVPAVVAMQFPVEAQAASRFTEVLYRELLNNERLPTAVSRAQTQLDREGGQWFRPVLYVRAKDNPEGRLFATTAASAASTSHPGADLHKAVNALNSIALDHLSSPEVQRAVKDSRQALDEVFAQLDTLHDYKTIHDQIDALQYAFRLLEDAVHQLRPEAAGSWVDVDQGSAGVQRVRRKLNDAAGRGNIRSVDVERLLSLVDECKAVDNAVSELDRDKLRQALSALRVDLNLMPQRINQRLEDAAGEVRLPVLELAMARLENALRAASANADTLARFDQSKSALDQANLALSTLIAEHSAWQATQDLMNTLSDQVDPETLGPTWERAKLDAGQYFLDQRQLGELSIAAGVIGASLASGDVAALAEAVSEFRTRARLHFSRVDRQLLDRCDDLSELRTALKTLLDSMDRQATAGEGVA
jgi:hypothetical protein